MFDLLERLMEVNESALPPEQQKMVDEYGTSDKLVVLRKSDQEFYNFWIMSDGSIVSSAEEHSEMTRNADVDYKKLIKSGAVHGVIIPSSNEIAFGFHNKPNEIQISRLRNFVIKYGLNYASFDSPGLNFSDNIESPDHLEYIIKHGPIEESDLNAYRVQ